jgi:hypothetical protein
MVMAMMAVAGVLACLAHGEADILLESGGTARKRGSRRDVKKRGMRR